MRLFDEAIAQYLADNTMASVGMAMAGGQGGGEHTDSDTYAPGDFRLPKVLGSTINRKGKVKKKKKAKKKLNESKSIYDYLLFLLRLHHWSSYEFYPPP